MTDPTDSIKIKMFELKCNSTIELKKVSSESEQSTSNVDVEKPTNDGQTEVKKRTNQILKDGKSLSLKRKSLGSVSDFFDEFGKEGKAHKEARWYTFYNICKLFILTTISPIRPSWNKDSLSKC